MPWYGDDDPQWDDPDEEPDRCEFCGRHLPHRMLSCPWCER